VMIDALKRASAGSIVAVLPYFGYARQDRKVKPRTPISAKLVADLITAAGANRVLAMDLHAGQIQGFFNIPFDHLFSMPVLVEHLRARINPAEAVFVSPDAGGVERARAYSKRLTGTTIAMIDKRRTAANVSEVMHIIGDVSGRDAVIIDDMIDTAGTLCNAARAILDAGARSVSACATHGVLSGPAIDALRAGQDLPEDPAAQRGAAPRRGHQADPPRRLDQLPVHLTRAPGPARQGRR
jgi:ribose-phosphate pyrophosphokinase